MTRTLEVPPEAAGQRLDVFLAGAAGLGFTRSRVQSLIERGLVRLEGRPARAAQRVRAGERVEVAPPEPEPAAARPEAIPLEVVHEDADLLVIDKPRGLVVHPAPGHPGGTLVNAVLARCPDLAAINDVVRPGIVHRLDKDTTGLLVVAKNAGAYASLSGQLKERAVRREYLALVHGQPRDEGTVEAPIGRHPTDRKRMAVVERGRPAVTRYRVLERFPSPPGRAPGGGGGRGGGYALLAVRLETGRTHQIRVHMAHIGHPVAGDPLYGAGPRGRRDAPDRFLGLAGQALHAGRLAFRHPRTGAWVEFSAPPPEDFAAALARLRRGIRGFEGEEV